MRQVALNFIRNDATIIGPNTHLDSSPRYYYQDRWPKWLKCLEFLTRILPARGGNATAGLHIMKVAAFVTEDPAFEDYYRRELIGKRRYDWYAEHRGPARTAEMIEHNLWWMKPMAKLLYGFDVKVTQDSLRSSVGMNLSHVTLYNLSRLEKDPEIRKVYQRALDTVHQPVSGEANAFWNFLAASQLGADDRTRDESLDSLQRFPSGAPGAERRPEVLLRPKYKGLSANFFKAKQPWEWFSEKPLPFELRRLHGFAWQHNAHEVSERAFSIHGAGGSAYLIAYWLGRSLGYIPAPEPSEPAKQ